MVEATKSKVMSGTPLMNSMKMTQTDLRAGIFERRPNASTIPIGKENDMPVNTDILESSSAKRHTLRWDSHNKQMKSDDDPMFG